MDPEAGCLCNPSFDCVPAWLCQPPDEANPTWPMGQIIKDVAGGGCCHTPRSIHPTAALGAVFWRKLRRISSASVLFAIAWLHARICCLALWLCTADSKFLLHVLTHQAHMEQQGGVLFEHFPRDNCFHVQLWNGTRSRGTVLRCLLSQPQLRRVDARHNVRRRPVQLVT
jgi:hypothetical protein